MSPDPKDPFKGITQHRAMPTPGGRTRSPDSPAGPAVPPYDGSRNVGARGADAQSADRGPPRPQDRTPDPASNANLREFLTGSENRLLNAAMPLIALVGGLRTTVKMPNVALAHQQAVKAIREFEVQLRALGYPTEIQSRAHYVLCAAVDQAVLSTPWGVQSIWASQPLGIMFHREAWSGEEFFVILDMGKADPARWIDLLELQYVFLSFGFAGKYQAESRGAAELAALRDDLYRRIRDVRGKPPDALSAHWEGEHDRRHRLVRYAPLWVVAAVCATVVFGCFLFFRFQLYRGAETLKQDFTQLAVVKPDYGRASVPATTGALTLKQLLSPEEAARVLTVEDTDKGTLVSLVANDLFESGSATLNPQHTDSIRKVGNALNQVPGRVIVIGHTDDQPVRSLRFADNVELSRARAASVAELLGLREPARLNWMGLGSSAPRYPADTPEHRAGNRRVEIVLQDR